MRNILGVLGFSVAAIQYANDPAVMEAQQRTIATAQISASAQGVPCGCLRDDAGVTPIHWHGEGVVAERADGGLALTLPPTGKARLRNEALRLTGGRLWRIHLAARQFPGLRASWRVYRREGEDWRMHRLLSWQLEDRPRPGHLPLAPRRASYVQSFAAPASGEYRLEVELIPNAEVAINRLEIFTVDLHPEKALVIGSRRGPELFPAGVMLPGGADGMPVGWGRWVSAPPLAVVSEDAQPFLRIAAPGRFHLPSTINLSVERGAIYELAFRARGQGRLSFLGHALATQEFHPERPRVGDPQAHGYEVESETWQEHRQLWFAEAVHLEWMQPWFGIVCRGQLDVAGVSVRALLPEQPRSRLRRAEENGCRTEFGSAQVGAGRTMPFGRQGWHLARIRGRGCSRSGSRSWRNPRPRSVRAGILPAGGVEDIGAYEYDTDALVYSFTACPRIPAFEISNCR